MSITANDRSVQTVGSVTGNELDKLDCCASTGKQRPESLGVEHALASESNSDQPLLFEGLSFEALGVCRDPEIARERARLRALARAEAKRKAVEAVTGVAQDISSCLDFGGAVAVPTVSQVRGAGESENQAGTGVREPGKAARSWRGSTHPRRVRPQRWTSVGQILGDSDRIALDILQEKYAERLADHEKSGTAYPLPTAHIQIGPAELRDGGLGCKKTAQRSLDRLVANGFLEEIDRKNVAEGEPTIYRMMPLEEVAAARLRMGLTHYVNGGNGSRKAVPAPDDDFLAVLDDSGEAV